MAAMLTATPAVALAAEIDPDVTPRFDWLPTPFVQQVRAAAGAFQALAIIGSVVAFIAAIAYMMFSHFSSSGRHKEAGASMAVKVLIGAAFIASASGAIRWFSGLSFF